MPLYQDLAAGMVPAVKSTYWRGDDLVSESYASHSMVANIGASLGVVSKILPFAAAAGGVAVCAGGSAFSPPQADNASAQAALSRAILMFMLILLN